MEFTPSLIAISCLVVLFAYFTRSLTGYASALISIPLLALWLELDFVVPLVTLLEVVISLGLISSVRRDIDRSILIPIIIGAFLGSLVGVFFLTAVDNAILEKLLAVVIIVLAVNMLRTQKPPKSESPSTAGGLAAGIGGGISGGVFGASGPVYVLYLAHRLREKSVLRATLLALFAVDYGWRAIVYAANGLVTGDVLRFALIVMPALLLGAVLGHYGQKRLDERQFSRVVALVLILVGILLYF